MEIVDKIKQLKKEKNAVILVHNYQLPEIHDIADFWGDSLGLSMEAAKTDADVIVFCGVHFMAETAKILNPSKIVVLPDKAAGCSLEESCPADQLAALQKSNPRFWTMAYINCSAAVKALCDVICTSGNAVEIAQAAPADRALLFVSHRPALVRRHKSHVDDRVGARPARITGGYISPDQEGLCRIERPST